MNKIKTESFDINIQDIKLMKNDPVVGAHIDNLIQTENNKINERKAVMSKNEKEVSVENKNKPVPFDTAIIGIGQCGGNIAHAATSNGFLTCAVNTSKEDLANCKTDLKYEFKNAGGSGKERSRSKNIFAENLDDFNEFFKSNFSGVKNIIITTSASGGTGGGSAPMCARFLKDNYPNKNIFLIVVLGSIFEDIKSHENMLSVIEEINKAEVNYMVFDNNSADGSEDAYNSINNDVIDAAKFISRQYFTESSISNIDIADMQKLYIENKRMIIVSGKFDKRISNTVSYENQIINAIKNSSQVKEISNPMSYAIFLSQKSTDKHDVRQLVDMEFRNIVSEFGEPYEIYKHIQDSTDETPDFVICITGLGDCIDRYKIINDRLAEFNERIMQTKRISDIDKVNINARESKGVTLPDEVKESTTVNKSSLDMFI